jgi:tRNA(Phe) wybutosine-synthesizing methylase Tyw3
MNANLWTDIDKLHVVLKELEHCVQICEVLRRWGFKGTKITVAERRRLNIKYEYKGT